ncbi:MAG: hydroxymyristoyl-ACP dehydratase [Odoribacteraceae bacterium]|jgi:3-hydroxyacyl-[acyl-carrier-protein] dehydratase|nr:hydroxymyristoyl-ACP dehydratase [Odoribacteraceae bacterium]
MKLIDNLGKIERESGGENDRTYLLSLDKEHFIYRSHFPGNPVTPGACIIQLGKELMERHFGVPLLLKKVINAKFLAIINPELCPLVQFTFSKITPVDDGYKCSVLVYREAIPFAKLSLFLQREGKQ